ncbi:MAG: hypothetical protein R3D68_04100 [Hyphomicrobiaceae bacterium]
MRRPIVAFIMAAGLAGLASGHAAAQANCESYAKIALKQQQDNQQFKCGFKGDGWSADLRAHSGWCAGVSPDVWKKAIQERHKDLEVCRKR